VLTNPDAPPATSTVNGLTVDETGMEDGVAPDGAHPVT
jgi:hypothetical protein